MNSARKLHPRLKYDHVDMDVEDVLQVITDPFKKYDDLAIIHSHLVNHLSDGLAENTSIWSLKKPQQQRRQQQQQQQQHRQIHDQDTEIDHCCRDLCTLLGNSATVTQNVLSAFVL
ncbi:hypothetical protein LSAT2_027707 [Lamellibrachia satsuma]|nr:hypothetical protein LSAT2_027707 [Lamellibrachia satsuma]